MHKIELTPAALEITAASADGEPRIPTFKMVGYTGSVMRLEGWYRPVVVDLEGLRIPTQHIPVRLGHDEHDGVGHTTRITVEGGKLIAEGVVSRDTPAAREVVAAARRGFPWQASIGARPDKVERVLEKHTAKVNGRSVAGPVDVVRQSTLAEISFVDLGADTKTRVAVAAQSNGAQNMSEPTTIESTESTRETEAAETERIAAIRAACSGAHAEIEAEAIREGWTAEKAELEVLRASRPKPSPITGGYNAPASGDVLAAAVMHMAGKSELAAKLYGDQVASAAEGLHGFDHLAAACLRADGREAPRTRQAVIRAAFSTSSMPVALGTAAEKILLEVYRGAPQTWRSFAKVVPVRDFREHQIIRPSFAGQLEELAPTGEMKHGTISEAAVALKADTFAKMFTVSRTHLVNDDAGVFSQVVPSLALAAARSVNDNVYRVLLANDGDFFSEGNGNSLTGGTSALDATGLAAAMQAMATQRTADGTDLDIKAAVLVVPSELDVEARELLNSLEVARSTTDADRLPTGNVFRDRLKLETESRLSNTDRFTGASATAWYLFAEPAAAAVAVGFLDGLDAPTIETLGLDSTPNLLAWTWRAWIDHGAALVDPRAAVRSAGA